jgi:signal transduction histidine kinase
MRKGLLYVIYFFSIAVVAQPTYAGNEQVVITQLPDGGLLLNKGWKFQPGDNPAYADPRFDDRNWQAIDPSKDIYYLPQVRKAELGWFRLTMQVDSSLFKKSLALIVSQVGASEIYLNGKLIYRLGTVSTDLKQEKTASLQERFMSFQFDEQRQQVLAVRYSFSRRNIIMNHTSYPNACLRLVLKTVNKGFADYVSGSQFWLSQNLIRMAMFVLLGMMSLFLYLAYRSQVAYLLIGFYCIGQFAEQFLRQYSVAVSDTTTAAGLSFLAHVISVGSVIIGLESFYRLYQQKKSWLYPVIIGYAILTVPAYLFFYSVSGMFAVCFYLFLNIESLRVLWKAVSAKRPGAWILLLTIVAFYILFFCYILLLVSGKSSQGYLLSTISLLVAPLGFAFFLANEFGRTGRDLQKQLLQVKRLSQKTIEQEQEKQQLLEQQNETLENQVAQRTSELKQSLENLQVTQAQLIQREKMASLGEMIAGIAHEIQNPLNFVNNFSEGNTELLDELEYEAQHGDVQQVLAIARDIRKNEEKITHHGKRADNIVKGMLQHSRQNNGQKMSSNINALVEEHLRLSYHGFRTKDSTFSALIETHYGEAVGELEIVPQDIGRVLLNLFQNAFYAVSEKKKQGKENFEPTISVCTKRESKYVLIGISDNGTGIPPQIKEKVFQPFFTTKPTGEGTGLGLSLSYDIITKGHGGELKVDSAEGKGSCFLVHLPTS